MSCEGPGEGVPVGWTPALVLEACAYCFAVLHEQLHRRPLPPLPRKLGEMPPAGVFVTWTQADGSLRGCVGCLEPIAVTKLGDYALKAGQHDSRFAPVEREELPGLTCQVSVLHSFQPADHIYDWQIGKHGLILQFGAPGSRMGQQRAYSATYLPEVALEHNMSHEVAVRELVRKAGYRGDVQEILPNAGVTRYQSLKHSVLYSDWISSGGSGLATNGNGHGTNGRTNGHGSNGPSGCW